MQGLQALGDAAAGQPPASHVLHRLAEAQSVDNFLRVLSLFLPAQLLNTFLEFRVNALNDNAANYSARHSDVAKMSEHDCFHLRSRDVQDGVADVVARKDSSDLSAIGTPPRIVHGDPLATACGRNRTGYAATQHSCC